ncbi:hypothetical protein JOM56_009000 [Amanita muscaria]
MIFRFFSRKQSSNDNDSAILPPPPSKSPSPSSSSPPPVTDPSSLYSLIRSVPPQTFHTYSLDRLGPSSIAKQDPPSPTVLTALSSFFSSLVPPPRLHCVRCHKSYFDVENTDRSCLVPHDDDSAEVERVPLSTGKAKGLASEYETHWGCCERTVEGDGDMGPPDGWCYEGKHTADIKRARFRADSTPTDDKLVPCSRLRCPGQLLSPSPSSAPSRTGRAARKRARPVEDETEAEDPMSQTDVEKETHTPKRRRTKSTTSRRKSGGSTSEEKKPDAMEVDPSLASNPSSPRPKPKRIRKIRKSAAFIDDGNDSSTSTPGSSSKPRSTRKPKPSSTAPVASPLPSAQHDHQKEPAAALNSKPSTSSSLPQDVFVVNPTATTPKTISILENQLNNSVGSLSELSSIKSSSPGYGTKIVQRVAYVEVTRPAKRPLRVEETMIVDTDKDVEMEHDKEDKGTDGEDKETDKEDKEDQGKGKDKGGDTKHAETPKYLRIPMKARSSPRRPFKLRKSDLDTTAIKSPRSRTRTRTKPLSEVVETSVDAEKMGLL